MGCTGVKAVHKSARQNVRDIDGYSAARFYGPRLCPLIMNQISKGAGHMSGVVAEYCWGRLGPLRKLTV